MIYLYFFSSVFCLLCLFFRKIKINNPMPWMFFLFINLYTLSSYLAHLFGFFPSVALLREKNIIDIYLFSSSLSLLTYSILLLCFWRFKKNWNPQLEKRKLNHFFIFIIIFPIAYYFNSLTNWTYERSGFIPSLAAYFRNVISILTLLILLTAGFSKKVKYFTVFLCAVLTFISTQRTNFFIIIMGVLLVEKDNKNAIRLMFMATFFILVLGSVRNGVSIFRILYPILGEGVFGSWGMLNAISYYLNNGYDIYNIMRPMNPAINWLIPMLNLDTMADGIVESGVSYYPMGGFFFLSDAYLFNPFFGPIIYTIIFHIIYSWSYNGLQKSGNKMNFFIIQCLLFLFIKASIGNITAMLAFFFLVLFMYKLFESLLLTSTQNIRKMNTRSIEKVVISHDKFIKI